MLICKDKSNSFQNKNFVKKKPRKVFLVQEEYMSDDEVKEQVREVLGVSYVAIASTSSP
jgi:hypothetical protein